MEGEKEKTDKTNLFITIFYENEKNMPGIILVPTWLENIYAETYIYSSQATRIAIHLFECSVSALALAFAIAVIRVGVSQGYPASLFGWV